MSDALFIGVTLVLIPGLVLIFLRNFSVRVLVCALCGWPILWWRMISLEQSAPDGELDIIFMIAMAIWSGIQAIYYLVVVTAFSLSAWLYRKRTGTETDISEEG
ncbi:MAG: hypothetical protein R3C11_20020 [Planctomycetaceae bacterium]